MAQQNHNIDACLQIIRKLIDTLMKYYEKQRVQNIKDNLE